MSAVLPSLTNRELAARCYTGLRLTSAWPARTVTAGSIFCLSRDHCAFRSHPSKRSIDRPFVPQFPNLAGFCTVHTAILSEDWSKSSTDFQNVRVVINLLLFHGCPWDRLHTKGIDYVITSQTDSILQARQNCVFFSPWTQFCITIKSSRWTWWRSLWRDSWGAAARSWSSAERGMMLNRSGFVWPFFSVVSAGCAYLARKRTPSTRTSAQSGGATTSNWYHRSCEFIEIPCLNNRFVQNCRSMKHQSSKKKHWT